MFSLRILLLVTGLPLLLTACMPSKTGCFVQIEFGPLEYRDPCPTPTPIPPTRVPLGQEYRLSTIGAFEKPIGDFVWSADGQSIFVYAFGMKEVQRLSAASGAPLQTYSGNTDVIDAFAISPHNQWVATAAKGDPIRLWRTTDAKIAREIPIISPRVNVLAFAPDSKTLAVGMGDPLDYTPKDKTLELYRVADGARVWSVPLERTPSSIAFAPDGSRIAVLTDEFKVSVRNASSGALLFEQAVNSSPRQVAYSPNGKWLGVAGLRVELFTAQGERKLQFNDMQGTVAFTPDSTRVVSAGSDINVRSVEDGKLLRAMTQPDVRQVRVSPDGAFIATASWYPGAQYPPDYRFKIQLWHLGATP